MKTLKIVALTTVVLFSSFGLQAQTIMKANDLSNNWKLITEKDNVQFFVKKQECAIEGATLPFIYSFLKIVNTSDSPKTVNYNFAHYFEEGCDGCDIESEKSYTIEIPAKTTLEEDCSFTKRGLSGFIQNPNFAGGWKFEGIEIKYLKID